MVLHRQIYKQLKINKISHCMDKNLFRFVLQVSFCLCLLKCGIETSKWFCIGYQSRYPDRSHQNGFAPILEIIRPHYKILLQNPKGNPCSRIFSWILMSWCYYREFSVKSIWSLKLPFCKILLQNPKGNPWPHTFSWILMNLVLQPWILEFKVLIFNTQGKSVTSYLLLNINDFGVSRFRGYQYVNMHTRKQDGCLSSLIFIGFPARFHSPVSWSIILCMSNSQKNYGVNELAIAWGQTRFVAKRLVFSITFFDNDPSPVKLKVQDKLYNSVCFILYFRKIFVGGLSWDTTESKFACRCF